jgi:hypothetical protein
MSRVKGITQKQSEIEVLRRVPGFERGKVTGALGKQHKCHSSYCSPNIITVMKDDKVGVTYSPQEFLTRFYSEDLIIPLVLRRHR